MGHPPQGVSAQHQSAETCQQPAHHSDAQSPTCLACFGRQHKLCWELKGKFLGDASVWEIGV